MKPFLNKNSIIAIVVIISIGLLYWGINYLKGINLFKPANFYYVKFEQVDGLNVSAPVTINGFKVGLVKEIDYDYSANQISVMLSLNKDLRIPVGSTVSLGSDLLGTAQLSIQLSKAKDYYDVGSVLESRNETGLMGKVESDVMPQLIAVLPKIDSILTNVNAILANPAINKSVTRLDGITQELEKSSVQLSGLMTQLGKNAPGIVSDVNGITSNLNSASSNLNQLSGTMAKMPLDSTVENLNKTLANMQVLTQKLNDNKSTLGLLMNDKKLYDNATSTVASLDSLLTDLKRNPKKYVTIKVF